MNASQVLRDAYAQGYKLRLREGMLQVKPPAGQLPDPDLLADIWAHSHELGIYLAIEQPKPRCSCCGWEMSVVRVRDICGRCAALSPAVRYALQQGARFVDDEDEHDPKFDRWRAFKRQLAKAKGKKEEEHAK